MNDGDFDELLRKMNGEIIEEVDGWIEVYWLEFLMRLRSRLDTYDDDMRARAEALLRRNGVKLDEKS